MERIQSDLISIFVCLGGKQMALLFAHAELL